MFDNNVDGIDEAQHRRCHAGIGGQTQRLDGEGGKAVHPQAQQLADGVAGFTLLPLPVVHRHIAQLPGGAEHQPVHIGEAVLVVEHFIDNEALGGQIAGDGQVLGLAQHDLGHFVVDAGAPVAESGMLLMLIGGVDHVIALLQLLKQLAHLIGGRLAVIVQADHNIPGAVVKTGHQRPVLTEVSGQVHGGDMTVLPCQGGDHSKGVVRGAIVHQNDLIVVFRQRGHGTPDLIHHAADGVGGMIAGDNERNQFHLTSSSSLNMAMKITSLYSPSSFTMWRKMPSVTKPAFS